MALRWSVILCGVLLAGQWGRNSARGQTFGGIASPAQHVVPVVYESLAPAPVPATAGEPLLRLPPVGETVGLQHQSALVEQPSLSPTPLFAAPTITTPLPGVGSPTVANAAPRDEYVAIETNDDEPRGLWRFVPRGMIPLIGPRTPERYRYSGFGPPLTDTSWLARPIYLGGFAGGVTGEPLIQGRVDQQPTFFGGIQYGWDYDYRWGLNRRVGYIPLRVVDHTLPGPSRNGWGVFGEERLQFYPWGDMRWRPYAVGGLGVGEVHFVEENGRQLHRTLFITSYGLGVKYLLGDRVACSAEVLDLVGVGSGRVSTMNNLTLVGGMEYRFATPKRLFGR